MPAITRRAAKAVASLNENGGSPANDDKAPTSTVADLLAEEGTCIVIFAMIKAILDTIALDDIADPDDVVVGTTHSVSSDLQKMIESTGAIVTASSSDNKEPASPAAQKPATDDLTSLVVKQSAPPSVDDSEPMTINKAVFPAINVAALVASEPGPPAIYAPEPIDKAPIPIISAPGPVDNDPAPSVVLQSGSTWSFEGFGGLEPCVSKSADSPMRDIITEAFSQPGTQNNPIILDGSDFSRIIKADNVNENVYDKDRPLAYFDTDEEATRAQRSPGGWIDIPGLQRRQQKNNFMTDVLPDKNVTVEEVNLLKTDLETMEKEHHEHLVAQEQRLKRLKHRIIELEGVHQGLSGRDHLRQTWSREPKDPRKRKVSIDEIHDNEIRIGTDISGRDSVYARLGPSGIRLRRKTRGKKRQKVDSIDFDDVNLLDSLRGSEESDIKAILEALSQ